MGSMAKNLIDVLIDCMKLVSASWRYGLSPALTVFFKEIIYLLKGDVFCG